MKFTDKQKMELMHNVVQSMRTTVEKYKNEPALAKDFNPMSLFVCPLGVYPYRGKKYAWTWYTNSELMAITWVVASMSVFASLMVAYQALVMGDMALFVPTICTVLLLVLPIIYLKFDRDKKVRAYHQRVYAWGDLDTSRFQEYAVHVAGYDFGHRDGDVIRDNEEFRVELDSWLVRFVASYHAYHGLKITPQHIAEHTGVAEPVVTTILAGEKA